MREFERGRGGRGGRGGGRGGRGGRGGGRFGDRPSFNYGPPERVEPNCEFSHVCGNQIVVKSTNLKQVPKFNRGVFLENKTKIG